MTARDLDFQKVEQRLAALEAQLVGGSEFNALQINWLDELRRELFYNKSPKARQLHMRISKLRDRNLRLRSVNYIRHLEAEYDRLTQEYQAAPSDERKAEIAEEQAKVSETLRFLRH